MTSVTSYKHQGYQANTSDIIPTPVTSYKHQWHHVNISAIMTTPVASCQHQWHHTNTSDIMSTSVPLWQHQWHHANTSDIMSTSVPLCQHQWHHVNICVTMPTPVTSCQNYKKRHYFIKCTTELFQISGYEKLCITKVYDEHVFPSIYSSLFKDVLFLIWNRLYHSKVSSSDIPQELEVRSLYSLKTKSSRYRYVVMTRSETKLSVAILAPVTCQSAVNVAMATSKCSITFLLPYDQDGDIKTKQDNVSNIL